jgi:outer membrane lipoprotein
MSTQTTQILALLLLLILPSCSYSQVEIPEALEQQIDKHLTFPEVFASPDSYQGRNIVLGGQVLNSKRVKEGTQIELLQLPLNKDLEPTTDLTQSQGRALALHQESVDPATLTPGMMVTIVGEVIGAKTGRLDEVDYRYPTLTVKYWHVWHPDTFEDRRGSTYFGVFGGFGIGGGSRGGGGLGIGF